MSMSRPGLQLWVEPTVRRVEAYIEGSFWLLANLAIAMIVFLLFLAGSWIAKRTVASIARRRDRADLGVLLGSFLRWLDIVFGLRRCHHHLSLCEARRCAGDIGHRVGCDRLRVQGHLQNWLSGLLLLPPALSAGDQIKSGDFEGTVERIEARAALI